MSIVISDACLQANIIFWSSDLSLNAYLEVKLAEKAEYVLKGWNKNQLFFQNTKWYLVLG